MPVPLALTPLPPGAVRATGWLGEQLRRAADGLTGRMMDVWPDVGPDSGWLGGDGERWERGPYYARGLVALAHTLGDDGLRARARPWIEWTLASQRDDGMFGPADNDDWWARMPMLDALRWHHEATADARVPPFLARYFRHQREALPTRPLDMWAPSRGGDDIDAVLWLHDRTGEPSLLALADLLRAQTSDWITELAGDAPPTPDFPWGHGVNHAMGLRMPAIWYRRSADPAHLAAVRHGFERVMTHHGQVQGTYSCDEFLHGRGATQGAELCTIVELMATLGTVLAIGGDPWAADAFERLACNAWPAILGPDLCTHQYFQQPNQVLCTPGGRAFSVHHETDLLFGLAPGYGCCAANLHLGWPLVVRALWFATPDGGLAAMLYASCTIRAAVGNGTIVTIVEDTDWPFADDVRCTIRTPAPVAFPLVLRIPAWATAAQVDVDGTPVAHADGVARIERTWCDGDVVTLRVEAGVRRWRGADGLDGLERGPLAYVLPVGEDWRPVAGTPPFADYELHPTTPWAYALLDVPDGCAVTRTTVPPQPWTTAAAPIRLHARGARIPEWTLAGDSAGPLPVPRTLAAPEPLGLVPFGCARLRMAMLPDA